SIDGDAPAAMRYTEARMQPLGTELLTDIERNTIEFADNFDGSLQEPVVLPASIPNLLVNGSSGIAVGMSTNIPPHNLGEVIDACAYMLRNWDNLENVDVAHLLEYIKGPDFPTGGLVFRHDAKSNEDLLMAAYATGRSKLIVRAKAHIEDLGRGKTRIIISEIPYAINKNSMIERIADLVRDERIDGISDLRDESDRQGLRIVVECKTNADPADVLNDLFKYTPLQSTFGVIMLALVDGEPRTLTLKQALRVYLDHRIDVVRRRTEYDLAHARARAHILEGLLIALNDLDRVIMTIRQSDSTEDARRNLMDRFELTEAQATAILDMQLRRLASLEREKINAEYDEKIKLIEHLNFLLQTPVAMRKVIADEMLAIKQKYNDPRRTIVMNSPARPVTADDLLAHNESTWVALTVGQRLSRTYQDAPPKITAQTQDPPRFLLRSNTADILYLITSDGRAVTLPVQQLPLADDPSTGAELKLISDLRNNERIVGAFSFVPSFEDGFLFFATDRGDVKRIRVTDLPGLVAKAFSIMNVGDDNLIAAKYVDEDDEVLLVTAEGQSIRFKVSEVRPTGLPAGGMRGIKLADSDQVTALLLARDGNAVYTITELGLAKSSPLAEYPLQGRAGAGVITMKLGLGDRISAGTIMTLDDLVVILTLRGKFKVVKFRGAPHGPRASKGDFVGISLTKNDKVNAVMQIIQRPVAQEHDEADEMEEAQGAPHPSSNGSSGGK
ncbi:MAG: DNA gyrase subunit A, partial [Anaerolineae bacterium]|nr:DNA gyrase subunit A [Anaerolineae bacterium]